MLKLNPSYRTKIYLSDKGYLVISQEDWAGQEQSVHLSPEQAEVLSGFIEDFSEQIDELWINATANSDD